jgi:histone-lysine N-methyltransferase SETMAR
VTAEVGLSVGSVHAVLKEDLRMRRVCAKSVPRLLSDDQMECRKAIAGDLFEQSTQDPSFLGKVVIGDESWVFGYDPEIRMQSSEWHTSSSPRPKESRATKSNIKVKSVAFFYDDGIVHREFGPTTTSVTAAFLVDFLTLLRQSVRRKWHQKLVNNWALHHDRAPSHTAMAIQQFLVKNNIPIVPHPPYFAVLAPSDFCLFPTLKLCLRGLRLATVEDIKENSDARLRAIRKEDCHQCYNHWIDRSNKCVCVPRRLLTL